MKIITAFVLVGGVMACTKADAPPVVTDSAATAPIANADPDITTSGGSVPAGYTARTDKADSPISGASYTAAGDTWEVKTGPAHIVYSPTTMGNGSYTASATVEQLETPAHPEAYGLFIGGHDLDQAGQAYTYFLVRGTGEMAVKVREGEKTRDVIKWTPSADVPKADASGKASYKLAAQVTNDAVKFSVNGKQVGSVSKAGLPTDGVAGLRINHNLHVRVTPVAIQTP
ncbi:MAG TPA: hypothetical protein VHM24_14600 [Gemmatimonadaceae bacterium]|nr:hypothetical protein [Gemmatimonadaceae bacterium]